MSWHTTYAAEKYLTGGQFIHVTENVRKFILLLLRTRIPMISRRDWQHCSAVQTFKERVHQDGAFLNPWCVTSNT